MNSFIERRVVLGFIVSSRFNKEIKSIYSPRYMQSKYAVRLIDWCQKYFAKYNRAPNKQIESIFNKQKEKLQEAMVEGVESILSSLSEEFESKKDLNIDFLIEEVECHFRKVALRENAEEIIDLIDREELEQAEELRNNFVLPKRQGTGWVNPFEEKKIKEAFEEKNEMVCKLPGSLGIMMNDQLVRDSFVALLAPEKRGKSFWLMELAFRAARMGKKVALLQVGDMTEKQMISRMSIYLNRKSNKSKYCKERLLPVLDCQAHQLGTCPHRKKNKNIFHGSEEELDNISLEELMQNYESNPDWKPCSRCYKENKGSFKGALWYEQLEEVSPLTWKESVITTRKHKFLKNIKLATYPNDTMTVSMLEDELQTLIKSFDFVPDVVIIDYADLLVPEKQKDFRHQQNEIWKGLRKLSQIYNCCLITATQSNVMGHMVKSLDLSNFSEDKRKYAHVTAMYSLNQTPDERKKGVIRIGEMILRDDEYNSDRQCLVLQCLQRGRPYLDSYFVKRPKEQENKKK